MRTQIRDRRAVISLSPINVRAYLSGQGWKEVDRIGDKATVHVRRDDDSREWEILLPTREALADFAERMADVVAVLAMAEGRDELAVFSDLANSGADVIRLRMPEADEQGTILIGDGVALYEEAENLLLAAACSVAKPKRRSYHARKVSEATEYLSTVRLGQTERGSYVMTMLSPVDPALRRPQLSLGSEFEEEPFSRQVTRRLADALKATEEAVTEAVATDDFAAFERVVNRGVNANLCESIARLAQHGGGVDVGVAWARVRPAPEANVHYRFTLDASRILVEAAREFRKDEPKLDEVVLGYVVALDRGVEEFDGKATLQVLIDQRPRRIRAAFEQREFDDVIKAFQGKLPLMLDGDIYQKGRRFELRNPRNITLLDDDEGKEEQGEE